MGASDPVDRPYIEGGPKGSPSLFLDLGRLNGPPHYMGLDMTTAEEAEFMAFVEWLLGLAGERTTVDTRKPKDVDRTIDLSGREGLGENDPMVGSPHHYARFKIEPLVFIVENHGPNAIIDHVIPYLMRYDEKNGIQDIKKAIDLLEKLVRYLEGQPEWWKGNT